MLWRPGFQGRGQMGSLWRERSTLCHRGLWVTHWGVVSTAAGVGEWGEGGRGDLTHLVWSSRHGVGNRPGRIVLHYPLEVMWSSDLPRPI